MIVLDELNRNLKIPNSEIIDVLKQLMLRRKKEIEQIKSNIQKYEDRRRAEERFYQSLSPIRKLFASRPPSNHQAVEYIVHVKERLKQIEKIKQRIYELDLALNWCKERSEVDELELSSAIIDEIIMTQKNGGVTK